MDNDKVTGRVFIDFRKAFDVIDHELLLKMLLIYGATPSSVAWFKSYLSISLGKTTSEQLTVKQGVPQGSISLGPVLKFLLFVNDVPLHVQKSTMNIYADDTILS